MLRQWNPNFQPSEARIDGKPPQMLFVSTMQIHSASAYEMIADAYDWATIGRLILAGGAKAIYEPWDFFGLRPRRAVQRRRGRHRRRVRRPGAARPHHGIPRPATSIRARRSTACAAPACSTTSPAWSSAKATKRSRSGRLINTGIQRLVQDLDELPHPITSLGLIEPPHRRRDASSRPTADATRLHRHAGMISRGHDARLQVPLPVLPDPGVQPVHLPLEEPRPAARRIRDAWPRRRASTPSSAPTTTSSTTARRSKRSSPAWPRGKSNGKPFRDSIFFGTEATEFDVFKNQDLLPLCRDGGLRAIWFGIEDMTAELVKKGQSPEKTRTLFEMLNKHGICPMPMMMHHDGQPLASRGNLYGLLNQVNFLRKSGSVSVQVTILTPSVGSKGYEEPYEKDMVIEQAGSESVRTTSTTATTASPPKTRIPGGSR